MSKSVREVLSAIGNDPKHILYMAESHSIDVTDKKPDAILVELSYFIESLGLSVVLKLLKTHMLKDLIEKREMTFYNRAEKHQTTKANLVKRVHDLLGENGPLEYLESCENALLKYILRFIATELPPSKRDYASTIVTVANEMGLEHFLSGFSVTKLKEFIKACNLRSEIDTLDALLICLMDQESIKVPYKSDDIPSLIKPEIDKNISVVDLHHHYFRDELAEWCAQTIKLSTGGTKKELVNRIRRHFDDKSLDRDLKASYKTRMKKKASSEPSDKEMKEKSSKRENTSSDEDKEKKVKSSKRTKNSSDEEKEKKEKSSKRENNSSDEDSKEKKKRRKVSSSKKEKRTSESSGSGDEREKKKKT